MNTFKENDMVITVGRASSKCANFKHRNTHFSFPIWQGKVYIAKKNYKGELKWFLYSRVGRTTSGKHPSQKLIKEVQDSSDLRYLPYIVHASFVNKNDL